MASPSRCYLSKFVLAGGAACQVVYGNFRFPSSKDVIFGKKTSIELLVMDEDGKLHSVWEQPVFGTIRDLTVLPKFRSHDPQSCGKDLLIAFSDSGKLSLLLFSNEMNRFIPIKHVELSNPGYITDHLRRRMLAVDPSGCFIAASVYEDRLSLLSVSMTGDNIIDKRITYTPESEGTESMQKTSILSMCFIALDPRQPSKEHNPVLAVLLRRGELEILNELQLLEWDVEEQKITVLSKHVEDDPLAQNIVQVPDAQGLVFLLRAGDILLINLRDPRNPLPMHNPSFSSFATKEPTLLKPSSSRGRRKGIRSNKKLSDICSWSWEPDGNQVQPDGNQVRRMIFCVDSGEFYMIEVFFYSDVSEVKLTDCHYKGLQPCKELLWVEGGYLAAIVEMGDGEVLKFNRRRLWFTNHISNVAPILDVAYDEKRDQLFACCGVAPDGSLRIIQNGISLEELHRTDDTYAGVTGAWTVRMKDTDPYHSFIVLSFLEETRIWSTGSSFTFKDVTDSVGFKPDVCTLACGLVSDGLLVQIYQSAVKLCSPTLAAHFEGITLSSPICTCWSPGNLDISLGAAGHEFIVVSTYKPYLLFILGVRRLPTNEYEIFEMRRLEQQMEISCISIPGRKIGTKQSNSSISENIFFVIGTHTPSVEICSFSPDGKFIIAHGEIPSKIATDSATGLIPQDVHITFVGKYYVLAGLRNGMLLRFEGPAGSSLINLADTALSSISLATSTDKAFNKRNYLPSVLQLIAIRRISTTPVFLVPLDDTLGADIIALSNRPWLLHSARHGLSYTSISIPSSLHVVTPVCINQCPKGMLFFAENHLHLVEVVHYKRLNVQKFALGGTPRKVLYHNESQKLLVMRTGLKRDIDTYSDICCVDPVSGSVLSTYETKYGEGRSMALVHFESKQILVVGITDFFGPSVKPNYEAQSGEGFLLFIRLVKLQNPDVSISSSSFYSKPWSSSTSLGKETWQMQFAGLRVWKGIPLSICPYLGSYFLVSCSHSFSVCGLEKDKYYPSQLFVVIHYASQRTKFAITSLAAHCSRIAVGDGRDSIILFSYDEKSKKLELLCADPSQRLLADCTIVDDNTAVVSDHKGSIAVLCSDHLKGNASPECNLRLSCAYFMAETAMSIHKCSYSYRLPANDVLLRDIGPKKNVGSPQIAITAGTLSGSIVIFVPLSREEYELLEDVQAHLVAYDLTRPVLGNDHTEFRSRENPVGVPKILDGDMLTQFLELTTVEQHSILRPDVVEEVVELLECLHCSLN